MANSMFEKTMNACLESRRVASKGKALKEAEELIDKELGLLDDDSDEIIDNEVDVAVDPDLDPDVDMGDFEDDIVVVVDPEVAPNTPVEDMPPVEEYVGDLTYRCPICGNTFFSEVEMHEGDECPVCAEVPAEGYDLVGEIAEAEETEEKEEVKETEEKVDDEGKEETVEDLIDIDETEEVEESCNPKKKDEDEDKKEESRPVRRPAPRRPRTMESRRPAPRRVSESRRPTRRPTRSTMAQRALAERRRAQVRNTRVRPVVENKKPVNKITKLDERSFNVYLNKFIKENYKNAESLNVVGVRVNKNILVLECKLAFNSGKTKNVRFTCEGFRPERRFILRGKDNGTFKCEASRIAPFSFRCCTIGNIVRCEGMSYKFVTESNGRKAEISGRYIKENKQPTQKTTK